MVPELEWQPVKDIGPSSLRCKDTKKMCFSIPLYPPYVSEHRRRKRRKNLTDKDKVHKRLPQYKENY